MFGWGEEKRTLRTRAARVKTEADESIQGKAIHKVSKVLNGGAQIADVVDPTSISAIALGAGATQMEGVRVVVNKAQGNDAAAADAAGTAAQFGTELATSALPGPGKFLVSATGASEGVKGAVKSKFQSAEVKEAEALQKMSPEQRKSYQQSKMIQTYMNPEALEAAEKAGYKLRAKGANQSQTYAGGMYAPVTPGQIQK